MCVNLVLVTAVLVLLQKCVHMHNRSVRDETPTVLKLDTLHFWNAYLRTLRPWKN